MVPGEKNRLDTCHTHKSAAIYTPWILKLYDWWVLGISNQFAWECPTHPVLLPFFQSHIGSRHMDVGVGTGFYLAHTGIKPTTEVTLLDINLHSLAAAIARCKQKNTQSIQHNVLLPLPFSRDVMFDSISLFYLLHCLPGTFNEKENVIFHLKNHLAPDGILYGATILGEEAKHNWFGKKLIQLYNKKGIFGNQYDRIEELEKMLERHFRNVEIWQHGRVALFTARQAKQDQ